MSMAKPIIVGAQGVVGFREQVIPHGPDQNGVHVNGGSQTDLAWGIKETLCDPERAKKWGLNGRKRVLQYFTWREAAKQTLQIYETLQHPHEQEESRVVDLMEKIAKN
jgi:glycosyltransferase involved in cell wall biosynthesis